MKVLETDASVDRLPEVLKFVDSTLEENGCPFKERTQVEVAVEELYVNICLYAYRENPEKKMACMELTIDDNPRGMILSFIDCGTPFNPLLREDPDVKLSAEKRNIGGLGIYIVKKTMDDVNYKFEDGKNILTIRKNF